MTPRTKYLPHVALLALAPLGWAGAASFPARTEAQAAQRAAVQEVQIVVDGGYSPSRVEVREGAPVRLVFVRRDYSPCTREVVFPALGIRRELPTDQRVVIDLGTLAAGEYTFVCGMNMVRGTLVVRSQP